MSKCDHSIAERMVSCEPVSISCPICLAKELAEAKRTNERLVELIHLGMKTKTCGDGVDWRNEIRIEFRRLGLSV